MVMWISLALLLLLVVVGSVAPDQLAALTQMALDLTIARTGWLYLLVVFSLVIFLFYLACSRFATLRIGGEDAKPEFSGPTWFAMLFSAGMGIGLVFWGAAEPISHLAAPAEGIAPMTSEAARAALRYSNFHWGLHPWAIYAVLGLALAWFKYNRGASGLISELLRPLFGRLVDGWLGHAVDILAVLATAVGVATSLGFGALQIGAGLHHVFGLPQNTGMRIGIIGCALALYLISSATGLHRGIKWLSNTNMVLALLLLFAFFVFGPTDFIFDAFTNALGGYLNNFFAMSLRMTPYSEGTWVAEWTLFYWAWWISWAPFVGSFIARVSYGRTVREFVVGVLAVPSVLSFIWFAALGGTALHLQLFSGADLVGAYAQGPENVLFQVLDTLPMSGLLALVSTALLLSFFVTSADSATLVLASMSTSGALDPPVWKKIIWGIVQAAVAATLLVAGGLEGLRSMAIVTALPFALILLVVCFSLLRALRKEQSRLDLEAAEFRHALRGWLAQTRSGAKSETQRARAAEGPGES
ncbi:MAG TPA: BCCT family transporter [Dokdonella sp.]|uniref:BCCT family transporter n=1 Tax=Dokdonella sp. TaxID=2291710 RepID=UPI002D8006D5|nr:BCCT family transporter [Dokdonella sp.]HET9033517.1 BCCT family transporter [Dokdonella sp.]